MPHYFELSDTDKRKTLELFSIRQLLSGCVIADNFVANAHITQAIEFTDLGESELNSLKMRLPRVNPVTTRMLAFLEFENEHGLFVDINKTDVDKLRQAVGESIDNRKIFFPWSYGRETVDTLVRLFGVIPKLSSKETISLLKETPVGVFQVGNTVVGPFGCLESPEFRLVEPERDLRGYVELRNNERTRRKFVLSTGENAEIFKASRQNTKLKEQQGGKKYTASNNLVSILEDSQIANVKNPYQPDSIFMFLGETLTFPESKSVAERLLPMIFRRDNGSRKLEKLTGQIVGEVPKFVANLTRPQLQQIFHLATNSDLFAALDEAIEHGEIQFLPGLSRYSPKEKSGLRLEACEQGVRLGNVYPHGLFATNIMDVLFQVFVYSGLKNKEDLKFSLDSTENDLDLLIRLLVSSWSPEKITEFLCSQRELGVFVGNYVGIRNANELTGPKLKAQLSYKLGVPETSEESLLDRLEVKIDQLESTDPCLEQEIDRLLHEIFNDVETVFKDILVFSWWALIERKEKQAKFFAYNHARERANNLYLPLFKGNAKDAEKPTLQPLSAAFSRLNSELENLPKTPFATDFVAGYAKSEARPIAFRFKEMFHNLNESSQKRVTNSIETLVKVLANEDLVATRNNVKHGNRERDISLDDIQNTISLLRQGIQVARSTGLFPEVWLFSSREVMQSGLMRTKYIRGSNSLDIEEPTRAVAPGLPSSGKRLYFLPGCKLEHVGSLRFAIAQIKPDQEYWEGFPPEYVVEAPTLAIPSDLGDASELEVA